MALEALEALEGWESESEAAEGRSGRPSSFKKPSSQPSFKPRPPPNAPQYVTQAQLEASLARVDGKVKTVSDGMTTFSSRLNAVAGSLKKEAEERKKTGEGTNKDLNQKLQLLSLLPLLIQPQTKPVGLGNVDVLVPDPNQIDALLPLLLVSGIGGSSGGLSLGGGGDSGSDSSLMLLALVLAFSGRKP
jgi:hypothetical protein